MAKNFSKNSFFKIRYLPLILLAFVFFSFCTPKGIQYRHYTNNIPQSIHVLEVDPNIFPIIPARALDQCIGRENVLSLSKRKGAIGGVNGGFFDIGKHEGAPAGILKINNKWYGLPSKPRGAIGWKNDGKEVVFDRVLTHLKGIKFFVDSQTGGTTSSEWEDMDHIVGGVPLLIQNGQKIQDFSAEQTISSFLFERHARTAIGILPSGHWVFVTVDGKQPELSLGMTMEELADFMESLGCTDALNLDGGGSTTFVYKDQVMNQPTGDGDDDDEGKRILRPVSDAILIMKK